MVMIIFILFLLGVIVWNIYPAIHMPHSSEYTTQDGLKDVITEECKTNVVDNLGDSIPSNEDFIPKEKPKGIRELSDHIKTVIEKSPEKVKTLKKRERKTVKKISDKS